MLGGAFTNCQVDGNKNKTHLKNNETKKVMSKDFVIVNEDDRRLLTYEDGKSHHGNMLNKIGVLYRNGEMICTGFFSKKSVIMTARHCMIPTSTVITGEEFPLGLESLEGVTDLTNMEKLKNHINFVLNAIPEGREAVGVESKKQELLSLINVQLSSMNEESIDKYTENIALKINEKFNQTQKKLFLTKNLDDYISTEETLNREMTPLFHYLFVTATGDSYEVSKIDKDYTVADIIELQVRPLGDAKLPEPLVLEPLEISEFEIIDEGDKRAQDIDSRRTKENKYFFAGIDITRNGFFIDESCSNYKLQNIDVKNGIVYHGCDSIPGYSGAPMIYNGKVIAVHVGANTSETGNIAVPISQLEKVDFSNIDYIPEGFFKSVRRIAKRIAAPVVRAVVAVTQPIIDHARILAEQAQRAAELLRQQIERAAREAELAARRLAEKLKEEAAILQKKVKEETDRIARQVREEAERVARLAREEAQRVARLAEEKAKAALAEAKVATIKAAIAVADYAKEEAKAAQQIIVKIKDVSQNAAVFVKKEIVTKITAEFNNIGQKVIDQVKEKVISNITGGAAIVTILDTLKDYPSCTSKINGYVSSLLNPYVSIGCAMALSSSGLGAFLVPACTSLVVEALKQPVGGRICSFGCQKNIIAKGCP